MSTAAQAPANTMAGTKEHMAFDAWARRQQPPYDLHVRPLEQQRGPLNIFSNQRTQHAWEGFVGALGLDIDTGLIAAAPELLEVIIGMMVHARKTGATLFYDSTEMRAAYAAIAKATGNDYHAVNAIVAERAK